MGKSGCLCGAGDCPDCGFFNEPEEPVECVCCESEIDDATEIFICKHCSEITCGLCRAMGLPDHCVTCEEELNDKHMSAL